MQTTQDIEKIYETSGDAVRRSGFNEVKARQEYARYVDYLDSHFDLKKMHLLDVGCGNGWSSFLLAEKAKTVTAIDIHDDKFEPPFSQNLSYKKSSATQMSFADNSFDIVTTHECLEHVTDPQKALREFDRVLKPNGYIVVVGPNLFSLIQSIRGLFIYVWQNRPLTAIFWRSQNSPRHPHGNTVFEIIFAFFKNTWSIFKLLLFKKPLFQMRTPDFTPPFHADNDACYYLNSLDLKYFFESKNYKIIAIGKHSSSPFMTMIPSGTWFIAQKPEV